MDFDHHRLTATDEAVPQYSASWLTTAPSVAFPHSESATRLTEKPLDSVARPSPAALTERPSCAQPQTLAQRGERKTEEGRNRAM